MRAKKLVALGGTPALRSRRNLECGGASKMRPIAAAATLDTAPGARPTTSGHATLRKVSKLVFEIVLKIHDDLVK